MTMNCAECKLLDLPDKPFLYEDDHIFALLAPQPAVAGHLLVIPKMHAPILENLSGALIEHLFLVANTLSMALFDGLHAQGTNILVCNGIPAGQESAHFMVHVIPRFPDDGLGFAWLPRQLSEEQMATIELQLTQECVKITGTARDDTLKELKKMEEPQPEKETLEEEKEKEVHDDYLVKHVTRIP